MRPSRFRWALNPIVLQVASIALAGALAIGTVFVASRAVAHRSTSASDNSNAALIAARIHALAEDVYHLRLDAAAGQSAGDQTRIPLATAIEAHDNLQMAVEAAEDLHLLVGSDITLQIWGATGEAVTELPAYLESETTADFESLLLRLSALRALTEEHGPQFAAAAQRDQDALRYALDIAWLVIVLIVAGAVGCVSALTMVIGRRLGRVLRQAQAEQARLTETGGAMARRNEQFAALYQIVSEVTETLSLKYVIGTTIREARKLVGPMWRCFASCATINSCSRARSRMRTVISTDWRRFRSASGLWDASPSAARPSASARTRKRPCRRASASPACSRASSCR